MVVHTSNILAGPLLMIIWAVDIFVFLVALRWALARTSNVSAVRIRASLQAIADPLPAALNSWLIRKRRRAVPGWLPWALVLTGAIVVRQLVALIVIAAM
jgi:hypothetical protein